ncbi:tRNA uridine-5-carboxymethylaminomethyl(34) synthesis GTPase MnmE [Pectinatus cerevisiiphilus]|uniref:tRNA modification GTPase MnmE n=1 Tax=Pectinatus cerevisiiphilus TaxID=86956 RepID=A0A4R3KFA6_9FIRM|nr:tRNA uridine-5-carboxymethylaminomethyl(34) synthesis GTPase MnmE [Pectinatus cerevisiiphilus]TCS81870.1 tRNA modification GTPase [Pectinatus cerevisiiphilus]
MVYKEKNDTIAAIATPLGEGGIGVIRVSGADSIQMVDKIFLAANKRALADRRSYRAVYGKISDPKTKNIIDEVICILMREPHSYTKENVVEIQCHGGIMPLRKILSLLLEWGARLAEPGEFTKRAFLNGRIDLAQAQAVMDIIKAKTDASLRVATGHLSGYFSSNIRQIRDALLEMIAHYEAAIDFPEEEVDNIDNIQVMERIEELKVKINTMISSAKTGRILNEGLVTAIVGKPNVGKSSLLNRLLHSDRAIVTDVPGTTRDSIEEYVDVDGIPLRIIDTAGIRQTDDEVEKIGVDKARSYIERADLVLALFDGAKAMTAEDTKIIELIRKKNAVVVINKSDLVQNLDESYIRKQCSDSKIIHISTIQEEGIKELVETIKEKVYAGNVVYNEGEFVNNIYQLEALKKAGQHLEDAMKSLDNDIPEDLVVIDLRSAWEKLGDIIGDTVNEDIIDEIFSRFCIGK